MTSRALALLSGLAIAACVPAHTHHTAMPLAKGDVQLGWRDANYIFLEDEEPDEPAAVPALLQYLPVMLSGNLSKGLTDQIEVGADLGVHGLEAHAKIGYGKLHGPAAAVMPSAHLSLAGVGGEVLGLLTYGPVTAVGFVGSWPNKTDDPDDVERFVLFGGGLSFHGRTGYFVGAEAQRADDLEVTVVLLQGGGVINWMK